MARKTLEGLEAEPIIVDGIRRLEGIVRTFGPDVVLQEVSENVLPANVRKRFNRAAFTLVGDIGLTRSQAFEQGITVVMLAFDPAGIEADPTTDDRGGGFNAAQLLERARRLHSRWLQLPPVLVGTSGPPPAPESPARKRKAPLGAIIGGVLLVGAVAVAASRS